MATFPRVFAILEEGSLSVTGSFSLYRARQVSEEVIYRFAHMQEKVVCTETGRDIDADTDPVLFSVRFNHTEVRTIVIGCWNTGITLTCPSESDTPIPVFDFLHRHSLFLEPYNQSYPSTFRELIHSQIIGRAKAYEWINRFWPRWVYDAPAIKGTPKSRESVADAGTIPRFVIEAIIEKDPTQECAITFNRLKDCKVVAVANCFHCFEKEAIEEWLENNRHCPSCKMRIRNLTDYKQMV